MRKITCCESEEGGAENDGASLHPLDLTREPRLAKVYRGECDDTSAQSHQQRSGNRDHQQQHYNTTLNNATMQHIP